VAIGQSFSSVERTRAESGLAEFVPTR